MLPSWQISEAVRLLVSILRRPAGLSRLWLERMEGARLVETEGAQEDALERAFAMLARFDRDEPAHRAALLMVLRETVAAPDGWPGKPPPPALPMRRSPRATAAHPRAFRGTTTKPPKAPRSRIDARPYLDRTAALRALGMDIGDPYLRTHHATDDGSLDVLSPRFRAYVLPLLRGLRWRSVLGLAHRFDAIVRELPGSEPLLVSIAERARHGVGPWWDGVLARPTWARRAWLEQAASISEPSSMDAVAVSDALRRVEALGEDAFALRAETYVRLLVAGASPEYAASGIELATEYPSRYGWRFADPPAGRIDAAALVRRVMASLEPFREDWEPGSYAERCWSLLGALPGSPRALQLVCDAPLEREVRREWIGVLADFARRGAAQWSSCAAVVERAITEDAVPHPEHLVFCCDRLDATRLERAIALSRRAGDRSWETLSALLAIDARMDATAVGAAALDAVARATAGRNDWALVLRGLDALSREVPELVARLLDAQPRALLRTARTLGVMRRERAGAVVRRARNDAGFTPPSTLDEWRAAAASSYTRDPFARALREHLGGERALRPAQLQRHLRIARRRWDGARLDLIERYAREELSHSVGDAEGDAWEHALALLADAERHRRGLARALRAWIRGDHAVIDRHPASRAWLSKHPRLDAERWRDGIELERDVPRVGRVCLSVERDLLEVLRLGTYVGSCLSVGGGFASDAAGVALDVNKRVVYARDERGRVLARQLMAISEADELVCFHVYPIGSPAPLVELFREYDRALAARLALPLCGEEYEVANVLSVALWDDGAWDLA